MHQEEKYNLNWHTYSDHLRNILKEMRSDDSFADVTLVTDDKKQIKAHRNILSASSPVLKDILQINKDMRHPVIYLRGIQHSEMESILEFIYLGQAKFYEERMNELLLVAKNLNISELGKGIEVRHSAEVNETTINEETESVIVTEIVKEISSRLCADNATESQLRTQGRGVSKDYNFHCQQCDKAYTRNESLKIHMQYVHEGIKYVCDQCDNQYGQESDLIQHIQSAHESSLSIHIRSKHEDVKYACGQCDQQFTRQNNLNTHIRTIHEGVKYACNQCYKQFTSQSFLIVHTQSAHEGVKYDCKQCDQQFTQLASLNRHTKSVHEGVKYPCDQCDKQFSQKSVKARHIQTWNIGNRHPE